MNRERQNDFSQKVEQAFGRQRPIERETAPRLDGAPPLSALPLLREPGSAGWAQPRIQSTEPREPQPDGAGSKIVCAGRSPLMTIDDQRRLPPIHTDSALP